HGAGDGDRAAALLARLGPRRGAGGDAAGDEEPERAHDGTRRDPGPRRVIVAGEREGEGDGTGHGRERGPRPGQPQHGADDRARGEGEADALACGEKRAHREWRRVTVARCAGPGGLAGAQPPKRSVRPQPASRTLSGPSVWTARRGWQESRARRTLTVSAAMFVALRRSTSRFGVRGARLQARDCSP